jgi:hypothetical protein
MHMPSRQRSNFTKRQALDADAQAWLRAEPHGFFWLKGDDKLKALWLEHGDDIVAEHVAEFPGTRPRRWWEYDAPRSARGTYPGCCYDAELPEPRKRLGGIGTPAYEVLCYKPSFQFGLPTSWISESDVDYYSGTMRHVVTGHLVNPKPPGHIFKGLAIDPNDPPLYESEARFLDRNGLFLPGEKKRLKAKDFEPETLAYVDNE